MQSAYPPNAAKLAAAEKKSGATIVAGKALSEAAPPTGSPLKQEPSVAENQSGAVVIASAEAPPVDAPPPKARAPRVVYTPIDQETRSHVGTQQAGYYLGRAAQTLRIWSCREDGPVRPIRVHGRLMWPMAGIRAALGLS